MSEFQYKAGLHHVGSYQISGIPFLTGSITAPSSSAEPIKITFPSVTQRIWIHNNSDSARLRVGFSANGIKNGNHMLVDGNSGNDTSQVQEMKVRATSIYLLSDSASQVCTPVCVFAELTGITGYDLDAAYSGSVGIG